MRHPKNNFYRKLRLDKEIKNAIRFYNEIKKKMLEDLGHQGYYIKKKKGEKIK